MNTSHVVCGIELIRSRTLLHAGVSNKQLWGIVSYISLNRDIGMAIADEGINITPEQWSVLSYLWDENGLTIGEIALRSRKDFANITRIVDKLQKQDYILKKKHEKDGRSYLVYYTEKAENIRSRIEECQKRSSDISLNGISEEEQRYIMDIIDRMEKNSLDFLNK